MLGTPNAGKSMLMNSLVRTKIAATSRKRHTTRGEILGVYNHRNVQLAFYDTPGFMANFQALKKDSKALRVMAASAVAKSDVVLLVVDAARAINDNYKITFAEMVRIALDHAKVEIILVLNKVDLVNPKCDLLDTTRTLVSLINGIKLGPEGADQAQLDTTTFMISALENDGILDLKNYLISVARPKPWALAKGRGPTSLTMEQRVQEIMLEMLMDHTHEEIPYIANITCKTISPGIGENIMKIEVMIDVDNNRQQRIVVGQQGRTLVKIRQSAAESLEKLFGKKVLLYIWVNVKKDDDAELGEGSGALLAD